MSYISQVLEIAKSDLAKAFHHYSAFISQAPKKYYPRVGMYSKQNAQLRTKNVNYSTELTKWKVDKLFPFFLSNGYTTKELNEAWKISIFKK
jgi:hypothetical protein